MPRGVRIIPKHVLITRWKHVARVLKGLSRFERKHLWTPDYVADKTEHGIAACTAGHCGLDPWFRKRGFKTVAQRRTNRFDTSCSWYRFFGRTGGEIFSNTRYRSVPEEIKNVERHIKWLQKNYDPAVEFG